MSRSGPALIGILLAAWQLAQATNEDEARPWADAMETRGATPQEVDEAWDRFRETQEGSVRRIHSQPNRDYAEGPPNRDNL